MGWLVLFAPVVFLTSTVLYRLVSNLAKARNAAEADRTRPQRLGDAFRRAAKALGMTLARPDRATGRVEGVDLRMDLETDEIVLSARVPEGLRCLPFGGLEDPERLPPTGDLDFDRRVRVHGPEVWCISLLDHGRRAQIGHLIELLYGQIDRGVARAVIRDGWASPLDLEAAAGRLARLAKTLQIPGDPLQGLTENALHDPVAAVRCRNLRLLIERFRGTEECRRAAEGALKSKDPQERLQAAIELHSVVDLREIALDRKADEDTQLRALTLVARELPRETAALAIDSLVSVLASPSGLEQVLEMARDLGYLPRKRLEELISLGSGERSLTIARTLSRFHDSAAEPLLVRLASSDSALVARTALGALGIWGSVASVEGLLPLAQHRGPCREDAEQAIHLIQERAKGGAGELSIAAPGEEGNLSLAQSGQTGALSVATRKETAR